jgi:hypothetical protein
MSNRREWRPVTKAKPCPACGKPDWCAWTREGWLKCERSEETPSGMVRVSVKDGGGVFRPADGAHARARTAPAGRGKVAKPTRSPAPNKCVGDGDTERYSTELGAITELERRFRRTNAGYWTYLDAARAPVFVSVRFDLPPDASKPSLKARKTFRPVARVDGGWIIGDPPGPLPLYHLPDLLATPAGSRVYVTEGEKAADVARAVGLVATTSPHGSKAAGKANWSPVAGRHVVILVDHDAPGEKYADDVARLCMAAGALSVRLVRLVELWAWMPEGGDMADFVEHRGGDVDTIRAEVEELAGRTELANPEAVGPTESNDDDGEEAAPSQSERVVRLVLELYRLGQTPKRELFAVMNRGANVAQMLGDSGGSLRDTVASEYRRRYGRVMNTTAFGDAIATLRGEAMNAPIEAAYIRVGPYGEGVVLDLGTVDGDAVVIGRSGWRIVPRSPILFQRTALTGVLPVPVRGGRLEALRDLLNVTDETWPILLGWIVAAVIPEMPHPILMLGGQQGTGKTTAARYVCGLFDPSDAPTRSQPRDPEAWAMSVANGWATVIDNVSAIPGWWSDALCKVVTGDGWVRRTLYTNGAISVLSFRRVVALTSIDAGALRGDLGERLVLVDLEPIVPTRRRTERELDSAYVAARPAILGAVLDLLTGVLSRLDSVTPPTLPRMADFARVLAAVDATLGTDSLGIYANQGKRIAGDVLDADPVGEAVAEWVRSTGEWSGTASALLEAIKPDAAGREWPKNGRGLGARLKRLSAALELQGVRVTPPRPSDRTRTYLLRAIAQTAQPPETESGAVETHGASRAIAPSPSPDRPSDRPTNTKGSDAKHDNSGRSGGSGGSSHLTTNTGDRRGTM